MFKIKKISDRIGRHEFSLREHNLNKFNPNRIFPWKRKTKGRHGNSLQNKRHFYAASTMIGSAAFSLLLTPPQVRPTSVYIPTHFPSFSQLPVLHFTASAAPSSVSSPPFPFFYAKEQKKNNLIFGAEISISPHSESILLEISAPRIEGWNLSLPCSSRVLSVFDSSRLGRFRCLKPRSCS